MPLFLNYVKGPFIKDVRIHGEGSMSSADIFADERAEAEFRLVTDRYHFFETDTDMKSNIGGRFIFEYLRVVKFEFAYRPIFKRSNIGRLIDRSVSSSDMDVRTFCTGKEEGS